MWQDTSYFKSTLQNKVSFTSILYLRTQQNSNKIIVEQWNKLNMCSTNLAFTQYMKFKLFLKYLATFHSLLLKRALFLSVFSLLKQTSRLIGKTPIQSLPMNHLKVNSTNLSSSRPNKNDTFLCNKNTLVYLVLHQL